MKRKLAQAKSGEDVTGEKTDVDIQEPTESQPNIRPAKRVAQMALKEYCKEEKKSSERRSDKMHSVKKENLEDALTPFYSPRSSQRPRLPAGSYAKINAHLPLVELDEEIIGLGKSAAKIKFDRKSSSSEGSGVSVSGNFSSTSSGAIHSLSKISASRDMSLELVTVSKVEQAPAKASSFSSLNVQQVENQNYGATQLQCSKIQPCFNQTKNVHALGLGYPVPSPLLYSPAAKSSTPSAHSGDVIMRTNEPITYSPFCPPVSNFSQVEFGRLPLHAELRQAAEVVLDNVGNTNFILGMPVYDASGYTAGQYQQSEQVGIISPEIPLLYLTNDVYTSQTDAIPVNNNFGRFMIDLGYYVGTVIDVLENMIDAQHQLFHTTRDVNEPESVEQMMQRGLASYS